MIRKLLTNFVAAFVLTATAATAATLNFVGTGQTHLVTRNDVNPAFNTTIDIITGDQKSLSNGLFLDLAGAAANVTYTFLGAEAGHRNYSASFGGRDFYNRGVNASTPGAQATAVQAVSGLLDFAFGTYAPRWARGEFQNNGLANPASANYAMGFIRISANSFYVLFDDIASGDRDFDDMAVRIDVAAVPLPAGALLLISAFAGAFMLRRRTVTA